jgi:hypothetical protein
VVLDSSKGVRHRGMVLAPGGFEAGSVISVRLSWPDRTLTFVKPGAPPMVARLPSDVWAHSWYPCAASTYAEASVVIMAQAAGAVPAPVISPVPSGAAALPQVRGLPPVLAKEQRVVRGKDWKWAEQDGGAGGVGTVVEGSADRTDKWVRVKWEAGAVNGYRCVCVCVGLGLCACRVGMCVSVCMNRPARVRMCVCSRV